MCRTVKRFLDNQGLEEFYELLRVEITAEILANKTDIEYGYDEDGHYSCFEQDGT